MMTTRTAPPASLQVGKTSNIESERLILREWLESDFAVFAAMNADPQVMEFFPSLHSQQQSREMLQRIQSDTRQRGFGLWACERKDQRQVIGFVGLSVPRFESHFTPCTEIGWRLLPEHWGYGFATEAARRTLQFGFEDAKLDEIVSFTSMHNLKSRRVMERIGMSRDAREDFDHPVLEEGHWLRRHVLYRLRRDQFGI